MKLASLRALLGNAAVALAAFTLAFLVGEGVARTLFRESAVLFPRYHTDYRYGPYMIRGIRPGSHFWHTSFDGSWEFVTNSKGFRNREEFTYEKPPGVVRILSLGDSHTQGYEVRQDATFTAVAARFLGIRHVPAQAINAGVSGFSTAEELVFLENEGYKYHPDVVVLGFFANDFEDNLKAGLFGLDAERSLKPLKYRHVPGVAIQNVIYAVPPVRWLSENSYFYSLLFNGVWEFFKARLASAAKAEYAVATRTTLDPKETELAAALLERMNRFCAERAIRFIVVDIPQKVGPGQTRPSVPEALSERLRRDGIEYVSSGSLLSGFAGGPEMHVAHGHGHISEFTHALIGVEIARRVLAGRPAASVPVPAQGPAPEVLQ